MDFIEFARICEQLEGTSGRLEMIDIISRVLPGLPDDELPIFIRFVMGRIFPDWSPAKLGIGPNLLYEGIAYVAGIQRDDVVRVINRTGDVGRAVEELLAQKEQTSFFPEDLTITDVYRDLTSIAASEGKKSQREKLLLVRRLFTNSRPLEGRYLSRIMLEDLRIGVGEGNVREAIARAFSVDPALVEHAFQAENDLGKVALLARQGSDRLRDVRIEPFRPVRMMLAQQGTVTGAVADNGAMAAEYKYDGSRFQFHKAGNRCRMYSRKLEDVTAALPDVTEVLMAATTHDVILDGEVIATSDGKPMPFQTVLRRFRRKYGIDSIREEIQMVPYVFDILFLDGETLIDLPLFERRRKLVGVLNAHLAPQIVSDDTEEIDRMYRDALAAGHEGLMLKVPGSPYTPGVRGKNWIKIKPDVDTLDLAVIGADWGEGKRAHVFGSFLLACQDQGELVPLSRVATGFSDEQLQEIYVLLKDRVISQQGKEVRFEPGMVVEVGYSEIQKSPNYESGFALRFPRFIRLRDDKSIDEIETVDGIRERYTHQGGVRSQEA
ncbi:MAG TPA: ATP-dependent DNA ligase [Methanoregulaceae archaeon]|nr:MAG: ATP-dependent DNA ligase [Methanolinea sp.]HON82279.1 ATP-dependent DNA ligase [Methanoregulaceae archaeon]HPD09841.1 ATP-dependent DNA ligase [Methanoregulaceae archaeon]HRT14968.1 ATP-dependent DNA ligase [Methanoregulaceae archaeon]HRU30417.1 ATP-dependent DNA ligase [Methanoregulaceae archaeon]